MCVCRFIRLHYTTPPPTDESAEAEADMAKMMFLIVKRQWQQHQQQLTALFAVCGHKQNYLDDLVSHVQVIAYKQEGHHCILLLYNGCTLYTVVSPIYSIL